MTGEVSRDSIELTPSHVAEVSLNIGATSLAGAVDDDFPEGQSASFLEELHNEHPEIEERQYQAECLDKLIQVRSLGLKRALVNMATGLGKTTVVATDTKRYTEIEQPGAKVLFLSHRNEIGDQARLRFENIIGGDPKKFGTLNGVRKENTNAQFLFASIQTLQGRKEDYDPEEFDYVIVDEGHHGKAESYEPLIMHFRPKFLLGLTATPDRADLQDIREIFGREVYSKTLAQALKEGLLARPDYRVILDDIQESAFEGDEQISLAELNRTVFIPKRDEEIVKIIQERTADIDNPRTIVFCPSIEHSERIARLLPAARALHSKVGNQSKSVIEAFRNGDVSTMVTIDMFNEGVDIPEANVIVFLRTTQSETIFLQQLGRGLRKLPGKEEVMVLDFVANCDRLMMIEKLLAGTRKSTKEPGDNPFDSGYEGLWDDPIDSDDFIPTDEDKPGDTIYIKDLNVGTFEFTETTRKIADLIKRIQQTNLNLQSWDEEDSVRKYRELAGESPIGKVALQKLLGANAGLPSYVRFLAPFSGSVKKLQEAAGYSPIVKDWSSWTEDDSVRVYRELSGDIPLTQAELVVALQAKDDLPGYDTLVGEFSDSIVSLRAAAGYGEIRKNWDSLDQETVLAVYQELSGDEPIPYKKLMKILAQSEELPGIETFLRPFDNDLSSLQTAAGFENRKTTTNWGRDDSLRVYVELCEEEGKTLGQKRLHQILKDRADLPGLNTFLRGFNGSMREIQEASGRTIIHKDWSHWNEDASVRLMQEFIKQDILTVDAVRIALSNDSKQPSLQVILKPFNGKFKELIKKARVIESIES